MIHKGNILYSNQKLYTITNIQNLPASKTLLAASIGAYLHVIVILLQVSKQGWTA